MALFRVVIDPAIVDAAKEKRPSIGMLERFRMQSWKQKSGELITFFAVVRNVQTTLFAFGWDSQSDEDVD